MAIRNNILVCLSLVLLPVCIYGEEPQSAQPAPAAETPAAPEQAAEPAQAQRWNFHAQETTIVEGNASFPAKYSGPNSLNKHGETRETLSLDLFGGVRLWNCAELHADALMFQGFGLSNTLGLEDFPNNDSFKIGTRVPNATFAHLYLRQTIGFGGEQEDIPDDQFTLACKQDISRLTLTLGRFSPTDFVDNNSYAHDARSQFMNWAFNFNTAFDYAGDTAGFTTGLVAEFNQPDWTLRYVFAQETRERGGFTSEDRFLMWPTRPEGADGQFSRSWEMVWEYEQRYKLGEHPGKIRVMPWLNQAHMASYQNATDILLANGPGADISSAGAYHFKYGFGLNWEQEVVKNIGVFSRLGWNNGKYEAWSATDVNYTASLGVSVKGGWWHRAEDSCGLAGVLSGASRAQQRFLKAGGVGLENGDGNLSYGGEKALETYYDFKLPKNVHLAVDYQFFSDPAFNRDRGPVSVFGARVHWQF